MALAFAALHWSVILGSASCQAREVGKGECSQRLWVVPCRDLPRSDILGPPPIWGGVHHSVAKRFAPLDTCVT